MANCSDCFNFGDCLQHEGTKYYGLDAACNNVEELCENFKNKADFVEVVRCEKCTHKVDYCGRIMCDKNARIINDGIVGLTATSPEHFCGYGKRKDE